MPMLVSLLLSVLPLTAGCTGLDSGRSTPQPQPRPAYSDELIALRSVAPEIKREMRYAGSDNFVGGPIDGYEAPRCLLTAAAAAALAEAQRQLVPYGLGLKVYDCYRPQQAVDHFMRWAADLDDQATKAHYYPSIDKAQLVPDGYIAKRSGHSRGSTVDLTLIDDRGRRLDMGTRWDFFDVRSHTAFPALTAEQRRNRLLLVSVMDRAGFDNYPKEWWHFTLRNEPNPDTYLEQPIR